MAARFPYAKRAAAARAANAALRPAAKALRDRYDGRDPATIAWRRSVEAAHAAIDAAYPPGFWQAVEDLRKGDASGTDVLIEFLEADPIFFRSGYVKERLIPHLKRAPLQPSQAKRLRRMLKQIVLTRDGREFRRYCRLAHHVDSRSLRGDLRAVAASSEGPQRRRAVWMLEALEQAERTARGRLKP